MMVVMMIMSRDAREEEGKESRCFSAVRRREMEGRRRTATSVLFVVAEQKTGKRATRTKRMPLMSSQKTMWTCPFPPEDNSHRPSSSLLLLLLLQLLRVSAVVLMMLVMMITRHPLALLLCCSVYEQVLLRTPSQTTRSCREKKTTLRSFRCRRVF